MLEHLMKKSVKIMRNPLVMKDAFRRFNFNKYIYTDDGKGNVECEDAGSNDGKNIQSNYPLSNSENVSSASPKTHMTTIEDATSECLPSRHLNKNLIKVEAYARKENHEKRRRTTKQSNKADRNTKQKNPNLHKSLPLSALESANLDTQPLILSEESYFSDNSRNMTNKPQTTKHSA